MPKLDVVDAVEAEDEAFFHNVTAIRRVEDFKDRLGRLAKNSALEHARREGRNVVVDDDVRQFIEEVEARFGPLPPTEVG